MFDLIPPCDGVDNLLPEGVLVVVVDDEVGGHAVAQKRIVIFKDNFNSIFALFLKVVVRDADLVIVIHHLFCF